MADERLQRKIQLQRKTSETDIRLSLNIDGQGSYEIETGMGFFDHMLEQLARHSGFDIKLEAEGDIEVDSHHTVEDTGILLGRALKECLGDNAGINRYGSTCIPMDESLCIAAVDICGRANLVFNCSLENQTLGNVDAETIEEFFRALCSNAMLTLHINVMYGKNTHHKVECIFKSVARALKEAVKMQESGEILSTKGCL